MTSESPRVVESGALDSKGGSKLQESSKERSPPLVPDGPSVNGGVSDVQNESKTDSDSGIGGEGRKSDVESSGGGTPKGENRDRRTFEITSRRVFLVFFFVFQRLLLSAISYMFTICTHVHLRLVNVFISCKPNMIWR